jgi:hypothetical protein
MNERILIVDSDLIILNLGKNKGKIRRRKNKVNSRFNFRLKFSSKIADKEKAVLSDFQSAIWILC